ncbi:MAG: hypothetical protein QFC55_00530 [Chloroflexota bacterium]|nr:hypothetical protein [Chloroflexota bacterium]
MRARQQITFQSPDVWFGELNLPADDPEWRREARISDGVALIAFPGSAVMIHQVEHRPLVADSRRAVMYAPGSMYRRVVVAPEGDRCSFMAFDARLAAEAAAPFDRLAAGLIDQATAQVITTTTVGLTPRDPGFVGDNYWVANEGSGDVYVLDANDGSVLGTFTPPDMSGIFVAEGLLGDGWIESFGGTAVSRLAAGTGLP